MVISLTDRCSYTFPEHRQDSPEGTEYSGWSCPHERYEDSEYCLFHMPVEEKDERDISQETVTAALDERIDGRGRARKQFIGAEFRDLDISHHVFSAPDNYPVDLTHVRVQGTVDLSHAEFVQPLVMTGAVVESGIKASRSLFRRYVHLDEMTVNGFVRMNDAVYDEELDCHGTVFDGADTDATYPLFVASFNGSEFHARTDFDDVVFAGRIDFRASTLSDASFNATRFDLAFFGRSVIEHIAITAPRTQGEEAYLSFVGADIRNGVLNQPYYLDDGVAVYPNETVYYNMRTARIGKVELKPDAEGRLFCYMLIDRTIFDRFEFAAHQRYLEPDWDIHSYKGPLLPEGNIHGELKVAGRDAVNRELTYLKARDGARKSGHTVSSSEFFRNRIAERARGYKRTFWDADASVGVRLGALLKLVGHRINGVISGHFERPWRVIATAAVITVLFALLFPAVGGIAQANGGSVVQYTSAVSVGEVFQQSLYFSSTTFTTLGYGDMYPVGGAKELAIIEAHLGALLMTLFVFVLGRRVS